MFWWDLHSVQIHWQLVSEIGTRWWSFYHYAIPFDGLVKQDFHSPKTNPRWRRGVSGSGTKIHFCKTSTSRVHHQIWNSRWDDNQVLAHLFPDDVLHPKIAADDRCYRKVEHHADASGTSGYVRGNCKRRAAEGRLIFSEGRVTDWSAHAKHIGRNDIWETRRWSWDIQRWVQHHQPEHVGLHEDVVPVGKLGRASANTLWVERRRRLRVRGVFVRTFCESPQVHVLKGQHLSEISLEIYISVSQCRSAVWLGAWFFR